MLSRQSDAEARARGWCTLQGDRRHQEGWPVGERPWNRVNWFRKRLQVPVPGLRRASVTQIPSRNDLVTLSTLGSWKDNTQRYLSGPGPLSTWYTEGTCRKHIPALGVRALWLAECLRHGTLSAESRGGLHHHPTETASGEWAPHSSRGGGL